MRDMDKILNMTLREYDLRLRAYKEVLVDKYELVHLQAWTNRLVKQKKDKKGTPRFKKFEEFFSRENFKPKKDLSRCYEVTERIMEYQRRNNGEL